VYNDGSSNSYFKKLNNEANKQVTTLTVYSLSAGALLLMVSRYLFLHNDFINILIASLILLFCGVIPYLAYRFSQSTNSIIVVTTVMISFAYLFLLFYKQEVRGLTVWAGIFVFLAISLLYVSKIMVFTITIVGVMGNLYFMIMLPEINVSISSADYVARIGIIFIAATIALYANHIFKDRLRFNYFQINEINMLNSAIIDSENTLQKQQNDLMALYSKVDQLAYSDSLTGLPNRNYLMERYRSQNNIQTDKDTITAFITIDLDSFKQLNDVHGHHIGDSYIKKMKDVMIQVFDEQTYELYRIGGDRFFLVLKHIKNKNQVKTYIKMIKSNYEMNQGDLLFAIKLGMSMGVSIYPEDGLLFEDLLYKSDIALQHVKNSYRGEHLFYSKDLLESFERKLSIQKALFDCLEQDELYVCYQPVFDLRDGSITGFEALMRWESHNLGSISPLEFIAYAEENRMILDMGQWIMEEAITTIHRINNMYNRSYPININVSAVQLRSSRFLEQLQNILSRVDIKPELVVLEITENVMIDSLIVAVDMLGKIKDLGVRIALDDFGTGYSSLAYLSNLPIDVIKIDRMFIMEIDDSKEKAIVQTILNMAIQLKKKVIAEGIETEEQKTMIRYMGCNYAQGYLMSKPIKDTDFDKYMAHYIEGSL
jgi:diguanylate cyclase (GGDEF)-like protein